MLIRAALAFVLSLSLPSALLALKPTQGKVTVFVKSAPAENGWEVPALVDSANDLRDKIGGKWLDEAKSEVSADLVVIVTNRFFQGTGVIKSDYNPYSQTVTAGEQQLRIVTIKIVARDESSMDGYGYDSLLWKNAANGAKKVVEQFVETNYQKIVSLRK
jgi:hypothetical protein